MEKLGRIRDAASDSSSVSSLGDLRSTDLMPSDCAWGVCMNLRQRKSLVARRETRSRGDLNFAQMHLIIAHAVRGATRNGAHVMDAGCGRLVPADQCEGRPPARARLLSSPAKPPVQMHCKHSQIARMPQAGREPLLQFLCVLPPVYTARLAAESGLRLVCVCTTTRGIDASVARPTRLAAKNGIRPRNDLAAGPRERRSAPKSTDKSTTATKRARAFTREVSTSKRLTP